ncbi:MAG TPA: hypothetical protein VLS94_00885, partial [Fusibacter sp.]|nr:hypothetical protein [Fusibacter sp.]
PTFGNWVNIPLTWSTGTLKIRRMGQIIHLQGLIQVTITGVNSAVTGKPVGAIPGGFPSPAPAKTFPITVNPASGSTLGVGICSFGNQSITLFPDSRFLDQNCAYIIDQLFAVDWG